MSLIQGWLTFAAMVLIQAIAAAAIVSQIRTTLKSQGEEILSLREWRHHLAPREMVYDEYHGRLEDHEARIRKIESMKRGQ